MILASEARTLALALPGAEEKSHFDTPDFRVRNKIFATLSGPDQLVIRIDPADQAVLLATEPGTFSPAAGVWGLRGWTIVQLGTVDPDLLHDLVVDSWRRLAPKKMVAAYDDDAQT
jgi:hypothetical protein